MKKTFSIILVLLGLCYSNAPYAQSIYKYWYSEKANVCLKIYEKGYSTLCDLDNMVFKYNPKKGILKMSHVWGNPINGKTNYIYKVEKLTNDSLILIENPKKETFAYMGNLGRLVFVANENGCDSMWIKYYVKYKAANQQ